MSDAAVAAPAAAPKTAKAQKKAGAAKTKKTVADHPKYSAMIKDALTALKERGGSSRQAVLKYIVAHNNLGSQDEKVVNVHLKMALRAGLKSGALKQAKGTGAAGSFKIGEKDAAKPKKAATAGKKPKVTKKPKTAGAATPKKPKKVAASGKPKVMKKSKSPTKAAAKPKVEKVAKPKAAAKAPKAAKPKAAPAKPKVAKPKMAAAKPKVAKPKMAAKPKAVAAKK